MGEIDLAEDQNLKRKVDLKVMPPEMAQHPERLARFQREADLAAQVAAFEGKPEPQAASPAASNRR